MADGVEALKRNKPPRAFKSKVSKHHWFKPARVLLACAMESRHREEERRRVQNAHKTEMYGSIRQLFGH